MFTAALPVTAKRPVSGCLRDKMGCVRTTEILGQKKKRSAEASYREEPCKIIPSKKPGTNVIYYVIHLHELSRTGKFMAADSRPVAARGWEGTGGEGVHGGCVCVCVCVCMCVVPKML